MNMEKVLLAALILVILGVPPSFARAHYWKNEKNNRIIVGKILIG